MHSSHKALDLRPVPSLLSLRNPLFKIPMSAKPLLGEHSNSSCIFSHTATCKQLGCLCEVNLVKLMHTFSKNSRRTIRRYQKTPQLQKLCPDNTQVHNGTYLQRTGSWIDTLHVSSWEPLCYHIQLSSEMTCAGQFQKIALPCKYKLNQTSSMIQWKG